MTVPKVKKYGFTVTRWLAKLEREGKERDPKVLAKIKKNKAKVITEETRKKMCIAAKIRSNKPEYIAHMREINTGKKRTPETVEKMRLAAIERHVSNKKLPRHKKVKNLL